MTDAAPKVFISYSHDNVTHEARVLDLADRLRGHGVDAEIDQYNVAPSEGWPLWSQRQIKTADFVLMLCTETYYRRVEGNEDPGKGRGVVWEAHIIHQLLYESGAISAKFVPVLFADGSPEHIPTAIKGGTWHVVDTEEGYWSLYRRLTRQPDVDRPILGALLPLSPRKRRWSEDSAASTVPADALPSATFVGEVSHTSSRYTRTRSKLIRLADLELFRDLDENWCPEMVALPSGTFIMGSAEEEDGHSVNEGPQHRVTIAYRFAVARFPITFVEYDLFCVESGLSRPNDLGWGRGRRPAINVFRNNAEAYCGWLSKLTGLSYRLPNEAEWEYLCRSGTTTLYYCGGELTETDANFGINVGKTTEVGSYPPNDWKLHDMHGNIWEWVRDIYSNNYNSARRDGSARLRSPLAERFLNPLGWDNFVVRGGSWSSDASCCRSAVRAQVTSDGRLWLGDCQVEGVGFRVARLID